MTPDVVVDVGNSRMKWGACDRGRVTRTDALPLNLPSVWRHHWEAWGGTAGRWAVAGSNADRRAAFVGWLRDLRTDTVEIADWRQIGVPTPLPRPDLVGHDRLLNARAAGQTPAVVVDAGTAVTVDLVEPAAGFLGGVIFPGVGAMARALHQFTAALPLVEVTGTPSVPGTATEPAMAAGIWWAVVGGVRAVVEEYRRRPTPPVRVLLTGGDAELIRPGLPADWEHHPTLTLEGIRLAAEGLP